MAWERTIEKCTLLICNSSLNTIVKLTKLLREEVTRTVLCGSPMLEEVLQDPFKPAMVYVCVHTCELTFLSRNKGAREWLLCAANKVPTCI